MKVAVIGSGISGLSAAVRLHNAGVDVELLEQGATLGGRFGVDMLGGRPVMLGGKNIGRKYSSLRSFLGSLGEVSYEEFGINSSRPVNGRLVRVDSSNPLRTLLGLLRMGSMRDLVRLARLAQRVRRDESARFLGSRLSEELYSAHADPTLAGHFGPELSTNLLRPMTVRMNGAEPDEVYLSTFGTNLAMLMDTYDQLDEGVQPVLERLARTLPVRTGVRVTGFSADDGQPSLTVRDTHRQEQEELRYDQVVLAVPANAAAEILAGSLPELGAELRRVRYFPSTVAVVEYDAPVFTGELRAVAMDDGPCSNAGAYGAEDRHIVRYTFSGKQGRLHEPSDEDIQDLVRRTEGTLASYLGRAIPRQVRAVFRHWESAYCAYGARYPELLDSLRTRVAAVAGLEIAGDYLNGVSLESCCRSGELAAGRVLAAHEALPAGRPGR